MVRTQIQLDRPQYERLRALAHRRHISLAEAVRRLIRAGLSGGETARRTSHASAWLAASGVVRSGVRDLGRRHDAHLAKGYGR
jgi:predicted DNA-binding ribbon-helix-helix protein